jgi:hypothetical protein
MSSGFDHDERTLQLLLRVQGQDPFEFRVHGIPSRWQDTEIDNAGSVALHENQPAEITVASHQNSALFLGDAKQFGVLCLRQAKLGSRNNVMPEAAQEEKGASINILVA